MLVRFDDIFGQQAAIDSLRQALASDRLPHGMIFAGPVGVGKATAAQALGAIFLCENSKRDQPCGRCASCRAFEAGEHPDFHVVTKELIRVYDKTGKSKAVDLSINVIRPELIDRIGVKPAMGRGKVFVIEQAERMNLITQNTLLKTLEEPPGRSLIILLTDAPLLLLPTVRSRAQMVRFAPLSEQIVAEKLRERKVESQPADRAAKLSGGSLGLAIRWLDDGVIEQASELHERLADLSSSGEADDLATWLRKSSEAYAAKQLERDPLGSKEQATREGLQLLLHLSAEFFRNALRGEIDSDGLEQRCAAIDALVETEENIDANVNVALALQQLSIALANVFRAVPA